MARILVVVSLVAVATWFAVSTWGGERTKVSSDVRPTETPSAAPSPVLDAGEVAERSVGSVDRTVWSEAMRDVDGGVPVSRPDRPKKIPLEGHPGVSVSRGDAVLVQKLQRLGIKDVDGVFNDPAKAEAARVVVKKFIGERAALRQQIQEINGRAANKFVQENVAKLQPTTDEHRDRRLVTQPATVFRDGSRYVIDLAAIPDADYQSRRAELERAESDRIRFFVERELPTLR